MSQQAAALDAFYATFDARVRRIVAHGYAESPALRARMEAAGLTPADIPTAAALARLPPLRKEALPAIQAAGPQLGGMLTVPLVALRRLFQSPGPIYEPEPDTPDPWRWAPALRAAGFSTRDIVFNAFSYHLTPAGAMFEEGARALGCAVIPGGVGNQAQALQTMSALGATAYVGLPSYLKALLEQARAQAIPLRLERALVSAEPLPPSLRALLEVEYGVHVFQVYGTAECGNLGYEGPARDGWLLPNDALVQVCDLNSGAPLPPGQTGEVVVTLFHEEYVLVRLAVGDLSAVANTPSPPGEAPRLVGWLGRSGDSVKVRGLFVHPRQVAQALGGVGGIARYSLQVTRRDHRDALHCLLLLEPDAAPDATVAQASAALHDALKLRCSVEAVSALADDAPPFHDQRTWE